MKFTRLRLSGFKSFVDPTELFIEPGLTGIVGPNGCGKSNLLEAMRWIMGENRPTSMRGSGMDDVIFGGTNVRPLRNNAEVTLFIDNSGRSAPAPFNEFDIIEVTRRIEREAGSAYRINGRDVRQRDVQIFFADASTGAASPALVRQGQISVLINQKPLARRAILEEAAGISGLHQRRHEAELRLKAAETNMTRLDDVIVEVEGQLQGLKRQARQASRYRNLSGLIRKAEALVFLLRWNAAQAQSGAAVQTLAAADAVVNERTGHAAKASTAQAGVAAALPPLRDAEAAKAAALQRLIHERDTLDAEETRTREEGQRLRQRIGQAEQDLARERSLEQDASAALNELGREERALESAGARAAADMATAEERARKLGGELAAHEIRLDKLTAELAELNASRASYQHAYSEAAQQAERASRHLSELKPRLIAAQAENAQAPDLHQADASMQSVRQAAAEARAAADSARAHQTGMAEAEARARQPLDDIEREVQRLAAEAKALANLLRPAERGKWPPLFDSLHVQPGYESALAAALGDDLDAPLDETSPQHWRNLGAAGPVPSLPAGAIALAEFVEGPPALARRLAFTGVVAAQIGAAAQKQLKPGQRLVTQRGDLWRWDGYSASADAPSQAAIRLGQRNRLATLERELVAANAKRTELAARFAQARDAAAAASEALRTAEQTLRTRETTLLAVQDETAKTARAAAEHASRLAALEAEVRRLTEALEVAKHAERATAEALARLPDGTALAKALAEARTATTEARVRAGEAQADVEAQKREAAERTRRVTAIAEDTARWRQRREAAASQAKALTERIADMHGELAALDAAPKTLNSRRGALLDAIGAAEAARKDAADRRAEAETRLAEAARTAKAVDGALAQAREERAGAAARAEAAAMRLTELRTRIRDELDAAPEELSARAEAKAGAELPAFEAAEERVEKLKREREQLGGVNLRAEEEANEFEERLRTLHADRSDLAGAIERLRRGIQSLNREGRERLLASFEKVNANFERLFKELFQGGEARLTFTESDDPLEAGLEILAKPPGKKMQILSLLSGGEQALTAIALIFAVFLVNPAPICVLDEVDAPLDDANVDRFCRLLDEMTRRADTRFLVITHHALTMSRMNRLFGVTMAERGVSQLVSVSLAEAEQVIAAE